MIKNIIDKPKNVYIMPIAPITAQNNAKRGLDLREKWGRGGTMVGVARARDLSNGADLSIRTVKRMASFNRHRQNYQPDKKESDGGPTAGTIAWLLWGGTAGIDWALSISNNEKMKQFKTFECKFELKDSQEEDNYFNIKAYGSTFSNVDLVNDAVDKGAFKKSLKKRMPKLLWGHNMKDVPIGIIDSIKEDNDGLLFEARLPKDDAFVRDRLIPQIKIGSLNSFSIGYSTEVSEVDNKTGIRKLKEVNLYEISLVTFPANEKAVLQSYKNVDLNLPIADRDREWDGDKAVKNIRDFTQSIDEPSDDYSQYFLYFDGEKEDQFTSYKLPFVDIIDNEPTIIPKAVFAIAGALQGARGGVDLPTNDRQEVVNKVNSLYIKMAKQFNDDNLISPLKKDFIDSIDSIRTLEKAIATQFSNQDAKMLVAKAKEIMQRDVATQQQRDAELELYLNATLLKIKTIK
jgi:HK97 family phage prohead protease